MTRRIARIAPHQAGKMAGVLYLIFGLLFIPFLLLPALFGSPNQASLPLLFMLVFPIVYAVAGYLGTAFFCWLYNVLAVRIGGVEFETSEG